MGDTTAIDPERFANYVNSRGNLSGPRLDLSWSLGRLR